MRCPNCNQDGISLFKKAFMLFSVPIRCSKCSAQFTFRKSINFLFTLAIEFVIVIACIWAFIESSAIYLWLTVSVGLVSLLFLAVFLPVKKSHQLSMFNRRGA